MENDLELNEYIKKWQENILMAAKAMKEGDEETYADSMSKAEQAYQEYRFDTALTMECKNFGMANYIFEDALPNLFKVNKSAVKEYMKTIKEDKNLLAQFRFYKAIEKYNESLDADKYINESLELLRKSINKNTLNESNVKLATVIKKFHIKPSDIISDNNLTLFENCDYLFNNEKKLSNLYEYETKSQSLKEHMINNQHIVEHKVNLNALIESFEKKYRNTLNEEEKSFVKEIMDWKSEDALKNKEKLFNKFKNECIETVNKLINESDEEDKLGLEEIKEQISNKVFCKETLVTDIAKLLEIRDVLMSE